MHSGKLLKIELLLLLVMIQAGLYGQKAQYLILGADFQFKGKWFTEPDRETVSGQVLRYIGGAGDEATDAITVVDIKEAGHFTVWVRTPDFDVNPRTRFFQLSLGNMPLKKAGGHGKPGYYWEKVGGLDLKKSQALLRLHNFNYGRCDAILLTSDSAADPNAVENSFFPGG
ncbi:hypothetical protein LWM68_18925 [Niabella sp. W65]|nr:hypothetical protein [Niabella sp. W65]MCH7364647.1 hypothetical protein [Niabella sp. W65]